jgi:hypothetical protein
VRDNALLMFLMPRECLLKRLFCSESFKGATSPTTFGVMRTIVKNGA